MMMNKKGQSVSEYVMVIGIVAAALLLMQTYIKRGVQMVIKASADELKMSEEGIGQFEGIQESGLAKYEEIEYKGAKGIKIHTEREIITSESPPSGTGPIKEVAINKDRTTTQGKWKISYRLEGAGSFDASEKTKKPPKTKKISSESTN